MLDSFALVHPIDIEFGPNGSLYVLNYGNGFFGKNQPGAELVRIDYLGAEGQPHADRRRWRPTTSRAAAPLTVQFTSTRRRPGGPQAQYAWDFDADGNVDSREPNPSFTYTEDGVYRATLR